MSDIFDNESLDKDDVLIEEEFYEDDFEDDDEDDEWRYSNYESKDISDWSVDDHLAAWYDDMMEK